MSPLTVTGLNGDTTYTFSVAATNAQRHWCGGGHGNHTDDAVAHPGCDECLVRRHGGAGRSRGG